MKMQAQAPLILINAQLQIHIFGNCLKGSQWGPGGLLMSLLCAGSWEGSVTVASGYTIKASFTTTTEDE